MQKKIIINLFIFFTIIISIIFSKILWGRIYLPYNGEFEAYGEYYKSNYNPFNEIIRYLVFISTPLFIYFICIKFFKKDETKKINEILFYEESTFLNLRNNFLFIYFLIFLILIFLDFLSLNLPMKKLDFFHEGQWLTPAINYIENKGFWTDSFIITGIFFEIINPLIGYKIFDILSIGSARFSILLTVLFFKFFLILFFYQIARIQKMNQEYKILFFVLLSLIVLILSSSYGRLDVIGGDHVSTFNHFSYRDLPIIIFLNLLIPIISFKNKFSIYCLTIGFMSAISMMWGIDRGAYLNLILLFLILFLLLRRDFKKSSLILVGSAIGWAIFYIYFGEKEFVSFIANTIDIYRNLDWVVGLIHPEPFSSDPYSTKATKVLILIIITGILTINLNFFKYNFISNRLKIIFIFIFFWAFISYRYALGSSDWHHIRRAIDIPLLLFIIISLTYFFSFFSKNKKKFETLQKLASIKNVNFIAIILLIIFVFYSEISLKKITTFKSRIDNYVNLPDNKFITKDQILLVKKYQDLSKKSKCVQIFNYDAAIPYLVKKPSCTKFYFIYSISSSKNQNLFIKLIKNKKPNFILTNGKLKNLGSSELSLRLPLVNDFIMKNYYYQEDLYEWSFYVIKSS